MVQNSVAALAAPVKLRGARRFRIPIALAIFVAWLLLTSVAPFPGKQPSGFIGALTNGPVWGILFAALFLLAAVALFRWRDLGLNRPVSWKSLRLLWLPAIYLLLFLVLDVAVGLPPLEVIGFLLLNTVLAAASEELMFRGVLFSALRTRLRLWLAITATTVLFGSVHLLNFLAIGDFATTGAQAVAAAMSGTLFIAIRLRTGSLYPAIAFHALWDFGPLMAAARAISMTNASSGAAFGAAAAGSPSLTTLLLPIGLLLPNFLYALFLLRRSVRDV
jgi:membrane protease YdiL (CAAX protease family)